MEKISIIITMYNCEKYVERLLNSIVNQTYSNLQIILIDDGSTDETINVCKKYMNDSRIELISQKNSGVSAARNKGINMANGKYIYFCDSDDYLENNTIEKMLEKYIDYKVELVIAGFYSEVVGKHKYEDRIFVKEKLYNTKDDIKMDFVELWDKHLLYNVWNKLYSMDIIKKNNIYFPSYNWGEDIQFNRDYLMNISSMYNMEDCFYHYVRARKGAATEKYICDLFEIRKKEYYEFCEYFDKFGIEKNIYEEFVSRRHIERLVGCVENIANRESKLSLPEKVKKTKEIIYDSLTQECLKKAKLKSKKMKILVAPFRLKWPFCEVIICFGISLIKNNLPGLYNRMKNRR